MTELQAKYKDALDRIIKAREDAKKIGKKLFSEAADAIFEKYPKLAWFRWTQYTPYFNDGDECIFSVHPYDLTVEYDEKEIYTEDMEEDNAEVEKIAHELEEMISSFDDDTLKEIFGDHVAVTVHRDGNIDTDTYDHD